MTKFFAAGDRHYYSIPRVAKLIKLCFLGLSLALSSDVQFPGLSLVPLSPPHSKTWKLGSPETWYPGNSQTRKPPPPKKKNIYIYIY